MSCNLGENDETTKSLETRNNTCLKTNKNFTTYFIFLENSGFFTACPVMMYVNKEFKHLPPNDRFY